MLIFQEKVIRHVWFDYYDRVIDIIIRFECAYCSSWVSWCLAPFFAEYLTPPQVFCCCLQMDNQVVVSDYAQMDRVLREERQYILNIVKQIKKVGCTVLLIQKSILRFVLASIYC